MKITFNVSIEEKYVAQANGFPWSNGYPDLDDLLTGTSGNDDWRGFGAR